MSRLDEAIKRSRDLELELAGQLARVAERHAAEPDVFHLCTMLAEQAGGHADRLASFAAPAGPQEAVEARGSANTGAEGTSLLSDLTELYVLAQRCWIEATVLRQAALATCDVGLLDAATACLDDTSAQAKWLNSRIKTAAPQTLTVE